MKVKAIDGIAVTNAAKPITLHILAGDCKGGDPKRPATCAAARAIKRELGAIDCRVHLGRVYIRQNKGNWQRYMTPASLRNEIIAFDRGGDFSPGEYVLPAITPSKRAAAGRRQGSTKRTKTGKKSQSRRKRSSNGPRLMID